MLLSLHQQRYTAFREILQRLNVLLSQAELDGKIIKFSILELQDFFRDQILSLALDDLESPVQSQVQSYQVEIDKQLRLLNIDVSFLQAAQKTPTAEQCKQQIRDRLQTLIRYCTTLLNEKEES